MPLDGHAYLVSQGWAGTGSGLRHGSIGRPIIVAQKKTLSGIGKDRDEAFPFWDHVFNAAANAIKVKVYNSDSEDTDPSSTPVVLERTSTGIISNRRPGSRTPGTSGTAIPSEPSSTSRSSIPKLSVMTAAKQAAVRHMLYEKFLRGPVLSSEFEEQSAVDQAGSRVEEGLVQVTEELKEVGLARKGEKKRKRKSEEDITEGKLPKREKKKRRGGGSESVAESTAKESKGKDREVLGTAQELDTKKKGRAEKKSRTEKDIFEAKRSGSVTPLNVSVRASEVGTHMEAERKWSKEERREQCSPDDQNTEGAKVRKLEMNQGATLPQEGEKAYRAEKEKEKKKRKRGE